jgi:hypothetical protein
LKEYLQIESKEIEIRNLRENLPPDFGTILRRLKDHESPA